MQSRVTATRIESIPPSLEVKHIDELSDNASDYVYRIVSEDLPVAVETDVEAEFARCDVIKFTDYYRLSVIDFQASGHVTA